MYEFIHLFLRLVVLEATHLSDQAKASALGQWVSEYWCAHVQGWRVMLIEDDVVLYRRTPENRVGSEEDSTIRA